MHQHDDAAAMAFAVLRNRGYRFLAVSDRGVVVSNGSPTLAIDVSRPVKVTDKGKVIDNGRKTRRYHRRHPAGYIQKGTGYREIMLAMEVGNSHHFSNLPGVPVKDLAMSLANAAHRFFGKGNFSLKSDPTGVRVTRK